MKPIDRGRPNHHGGNGGLFLDMPHRFVSSPSDRATNPDGSSSGCRRRKYTARNTIRPATKQPSPGKKVIESTIGET